MKVALTVPVLPSVTVASLMEMVGAAAGVQDSVVEQDGDGAAGGIGRRDVEPAVAVEVAGGDRGMAPGPAAGLIRGEGPVAAVAETMTSVLAMSR